MLLKPDTRPIRGSRTQIIHDPTLTSDPTNEILVNESLSIWSIRMYNFTYCLGLYLNEAWDLGFCPSPRWHLTSDCIIDWKTTVQMHFR
ncbi:hypothetical protein CDAR_308751 [Caerostris darwini]|uniref:Uncharacterized protein n=1 Tax=Caerostris darwini TaxID=1538125 RepID=A0AAV4NZZ0_9ARAC|nr:hypothetical protein CDAR_308751 [Caerostris darwini]